MISLLESIKSKIGGKDRWICQQLLSFEDFEAIFPIARFPADVELLVVGHIFVRESVFLGCSASRSISEEDQDLFDWST